MNDNEWKITDSIWPIITKGYESYKNNYPELIFHNEMKEQFRSFYKDEYMHIKDRFMTDDTSFLDSHKQAALLTICCLKLNIVEYTKPMPNKNNEICIIPQIIAINVGLSYMLQCLNDLLQDKKINKHISKYYFPVAIACDTPYDKIICRILYLEQHEKDLEFNVLELADRYFLLEYINLLQHDIEPPALKNKK